MLDEITAWGATLPEALHTLDEKKMTQATFSDKVEGDGIENGLLTDFFAGPNGKVLPVQYKRWIGENRQKEFMEQADNALLKNAIFQLYRRDSFIGDGGTADVIRFEQETKLMLGRNGSSHIQKGIDMAKHIENKILTQELSPSDRKLAEELLENLNDALGRR